MMLKILFLFVLSTLGFSSKIDESLILDKKDFKFLKLIKMHQSLIIDHKSSVSAEVYGPKGTRSWLEKIGARPKRQIQIRPGGYPDFKDIENQLKQIASSYPRLVELFSIGKSVQGRDLWVLKISDNPQIDEIEPEFKYISSMHGNEITGRELTIQFAKDLLDSYSSDSNVRSLINSTEIFIMPSMNPDGSQKMRRANANGVDLNRNFPDWTKKEANTTKGRQPETIAVMKFQKRRQFSLSANFHSGAVCVNYPWDSHHKRHPHDKLLIDLSLEYANENPAMRNSSEFDQGITNGADWYVLKGGMQDWSYVWHNDLQVTIELSDKKWPNYEDIPAFYDDNKDSMFSYLKKIHQGAGFTLKSKESGTVKIKNAVLFDQLAEFNFKDGEFYKVMRPGLYHFDITTESKKTYQFKARVYKNRVLNNGNFFFL